jgi:hypothetical protein
VRIKSPLPGQLGDTGVTSPPWELNPVSLVYKTSAFTVWPGGVALALVSLVSSPPWELNPVSLAYQASAFTVWPDGGDRSEARTRGLRRVEPALFR